MARTPKALVLIAILSSASACHCMARIRMSQCVRTEDRTVTLDLMIDAPGPVLMRLDRRDWPSWWYAVYVIRTQIQIDEKTHEKLRLKALGMACRTTR